MGRGSDDDEPLLERGLRRRKIELRRSGGFGDEPADTASTAAETSDETLGVGLWRGGIGAGRGAVNRDFGDGMGYFGLVGDGLSLWVPVLIDVSDDVELRRDDVADGGAFSRSLEARLARGAMTGAASERRGAMLLRRESLLPSLSAAPERSAVARGAGVEAPDCERDDGPELKVNIVDGRGVTWRSPVRSMEARFARGVFICERQPWRHTK